MYTTVENRLNDINRQEKIALFLDIDGILHEASKSIELQITRFSMREKLIDDIVDEKVRPQEFGMLEAAPQQLLADILRRYPQVVIVISSAWRNWEELPHGDAKSLSWLKSVLHPSIAARIIGKTPCAANFGQVTRLEEIRSFMREYALPLGLNQTWVAIDDQVRHFPNEQIHPFYFENNVGQDLVISTKELVLIIDGENALTQSSASALDAAIRQAAYNVQCDAHCRRIPV